MNHMVFFIEGNIGAGKSTIIERMEGDLKKNTTVNVYILYTIGSRAVRYALIVLNYETAQKNVQCV